jgi:hypothetical protein
MMNGKVETSSIYTVVRGWFENLGTLLGAAVAIAYISGFLISHTYLATYDLPFSTGELLKTKYIYIGFLFLAAMVLLAALFRVIILWAQHYFYRKRVLQSQIERDHKLMICAYLILDQRSINQYQKRRVRSDELRGYSVIALIATVLIIQAHTLNPISQNSILFVNVLFFICVTIYYFTFFGELFIPYAKGLVFGRRFISDIRLTNFLFAQIPAAITILLRKSLPDNPKVGIWEQLPAAISIHLKNILPDIPNVGIWERPNGLIEFILIAISASTCIFGLNAVFFTSTDKLEAIDSIQGFNPDSWLAEMQQNSKRSLFFTSRFYPYWLLKGYLYENSKCKCVRMFKRFIKGCIFITLIALTEYFCWLGPQFSVALSVTKTVTFLYLGIIVLLFGCVVSIISLFKLRLENLRHELLMTEKDTQDMQLNVQDNAHEIHLSKTDRYFRRGLLLASLYVTSIFSFSLVIYPHIPVQKAGGDFTKAPRICIRLNARTKLRDCPVSLLPIRNPGQAFIELDDDEHFLYIVNDHDSGGPSAWIWAQALSASHTHCNQQFPSSAASEFGIELASDIRIDHKIKGNGVISPFCRPDVYAINKECISGLMHFDPDPEDSLPDNHTDKCEAYENGNQTRPALPEY